MKVVLSKKNMMVIAGVLIVGLVLFLIIRRFRTKSTYSSTDATTDPTRYATMTASLQTCANALQIDLIDNNGTNSATGLSTYSDCLSSNVTMYVSNVCPASIPGVTPGTCSASAPSANCNLTNWQANYDAYQTDLSAIQDAYVSVIQSADTATKVLVQAARRADITGAIRRYLSQTCSNVYVPATTGLPDPTDIYKAWTTTGTTGSYRFDSTQVTLTNVTNWAKYAGNPSANPPVASLSATGSLYLSSPAVTTAVAATATAPAVAASGATFVPALPTGSTVTFPYWALARDMGPGTVLAAGTTIPVSFTSGNTPYTVSYTAPATIFPVAATAAAATTAAATAAAATTSH